MNVKIAVIASSLCFLSISLAEAGPTIWLIDTTEQWTQARASSKDLTFNDGQSVPTGPTTHYRSVIKRFDGKHSAKTITFTQSPVWHNWEAIENLGPANLRDAPVLLVMGPDDYWLFGRYGSGAKIRRGNKQAGPSETEFKAEKAELEGFDIRLMTTRFPNQFDAPGGVDNRGPGYHAWQSRDMVNWVHHGRVTEGFSAWVTTAEQVDGTLYIYYDFPNDQDPHLYIDDDLFDGKPGRNMGIAFKDPSDGSDCTVIRDLEGRFHIIYEDWSPINARSHSWDSSLAGHAVSPDGTGNFKILPPAVDERTNPTGKFAGYQHPHWHKEDPENFPLKPGENRASAEYEIHEPEQNAYGDWAAICVGGQYYLFCDYHPAHDKIRVGWFTSPDIDRQFSFCGEIGLGHPDPDIAFAEGKFYLITQMKIDYVSPGPWVDQVEVRVGVDVDDDGAIDEWTAWQPVKERYDYIKGFSKQVKRIPACLDLTDLPAGFGFCFEFRTEDKTENKSMPIMDRVSMAFDG